MLYNSLTIDNDYINDIHDFVHYRHCYVQRSTFIGQTGIFSTSSAVCFFIVANIIYS